VVLSINSAFDQEAVDFRAEGNVSLTTGGGLAGAEQVSTGQDLDFGEQDEQTTSPSVQTCEMG